VFLKLRHRAQGEFAFLLEGAAQKGSFVRNAMYGFSGKFIIICFTFVTAPLLTRMYTPEAYGYFAFMNTIASNVAILATLGFPSALVLSRTDDRFYNFLVSVVVLSMMIITTFSLVLIFVANDVLPIELGQDKGFYLGLLVAACTLYALMQILPNWNVWRNQFQVAARINILVAGSARVVSLGMGLLPGASVFGLIIGELFGRLLGVVATVSHHLFKEWRNMFAAVRLKKMRSVTSEFKDYPKYVLAAGYVSVLTSHIPSLVFPYLFEMQRLGHYSLAVSMVGIPGSLLAYPLSSLFLKKFLELQETQAERIPLYVKRVLYGLFLVSVVPFAFIVVFGPDVFAFVFGADWRFAGELSSILAFHGLIEVVRVPLQGVFQAKKRERSILSYQVLQIAMVVIALLPGLISNDIVMMVWGFVGARCLISLFILKRILKWSGVSQRIIFIRCQVVLLLVLAIMFTFKWLLFM